MGQKVKETLITPAGEFRHVWLDKPDTSPLGKNKFKTTIVLPKGVPAHDALAKKLNDLHKSVKGAKAKAPVKDGDAYIEAADDEEQAKKRSWAQGAWFLTAKTNKLERKDLVDAKKKRLAVSPRSGDFGKLAIFVTDYSADGSTGVSAYLNGVQLLERRNHGTDGASGFDEEDEYEGDAAKAETPDRTGDDTDTDDDSDGDGNF